MHPYFGCCASALAARSSLHSLVSPRPMQRAGTPPARHPRRLPLGRLPVSGLNMNPCRVQKKCSLLTKIGMFLAARAKQLPMDVAYRWPWLEKTKHDVAMVFIFLYLTSIKIYFKYFCSDDNN